MLNLGWIFLIRLNNFSNLTTLYGSLSLAIKKYCLATNSLTFSLCCSLGIIRFLTTPSSKHMSVAISNQRPTLPTSCGVTDLPWSWGANCNAIFTRQSNWCSVNIAQGAFPCLIAATILLRRSKSSAKISRMSLIWVCWFANPFACNVRAIFEQVSRMP